MKVTKFQQGGAAPAENAPAGAQPGGQPSPEEQIMAMAQEVIQQLGPDGAAMLAEAIMALLQQNSAPQQAPAYARKGGKLVRVK